MEVYAFSECFLFSFVSKYFKMLATTMFCQNMTALTSSQKSFVFGFSRSDISTIILLFFSLLQASFGVLSFLFGLCFGIILGLLIIIMTDLLGEDKIGDGLGYLMIADGIGAFSGPPVAGMAII